MHFNEAIIYTIFWLVFCALWAAKSLVLRQKRKYAEHRHLADANSTFKPMSYLVFSAQILLCTATFWSDSHWLLKFHSIDWVKCFGLFLSFSGLILYLYAQRYLGRNYSPCFDSHIPFEIVDSGPYKMIRHPGWLAKLFVGAGTLFVSGSFWFVPMIYWLILQMRKTISIEEEYLIKAFPQYKTYKMGTWALLPYIF